MKAPKNGWAVVLAAVLLVCLGFMPGLVAGSSGGYYKATNDLPNCQEDEVLYPADYKGPGENRTSDYKCVEVSRIQFDEDWFPETPIHDGSGPPPSWPCPPEATCNDCATGKVDCGEPPEAVRGTK